MNLNFTDLLNLVQTNQPLSALAVDVFGRKFSDKKIMLSSGKREKANNLIVDIGDRVMISGDFEISLNTLKYFGKNISKLKLVFDGTDDASFHKLLHATNEYCLESLIELELQLNQPIVLTHMPKSFKNVKHVAFENHLPRVTDELDQMNKTFPALQALSLSMLNIDSVYTNCHFPHLKSFSVSSIDEKTIVELLNLNPHIQSISLQRGSFDLLLIVKKTLPELKHLTIGWFDIQQKDIHFDSITKFTMEKTADSPKHFHFSHLQELEMYFYSIFFDEWSEFLSKHKQLLRFHLNYWSMDDGQFEQLTSLLPDLVEMSISSLQGNSFNADTISRFIQSHEKLQKINLDTCNEDEKRVFRDLFEKDWNVQDFRQCVSIQRKI